MLVEERKEEHHPGEAVGLIDIAPGLPPLWQGELRLLSPKLLSPKHQLPQSQTCPCCPWEQLWWQVTLSRKEEHSDLVFSSRASLPKSLIVYQLK